MIGSENIGRRQNAGVQQLQRVNNDLNNILNLIYYYNYNYTLYNPFNSIPAQPAVA